MSECDRPTDREFKVLHGNGQVREYVREGPSEDVAMLEISEFNETRHKTLDGSGIVEGKRPVTKARIRKQNAWFVLQALAEYFNFELEEA